MRKVITGLLQCERTLVMETRQLAHLPLFERIAHHKARKPLVVMTLGVGLMITGSLISVSGATFEHMLGAPKCFVDAVGYFVHGIGCVPAIKYIEPVWVIILGE